MSLQRVRDSKLKRRRSKYPMGETPKQFIVKCRKRMHSGLPLRQQEREELQLQIEQAQRERDEIQLQRDQIIRRMEQIQREIDDEKIHYQATVS